MVIVVTRAGRGDFHSADSFESADQHPLVQYGDVIWSEGVDIFKQFTLREIPALLRRLGDSELTDRLLHALGQCRTVDESRNCVRQEVDAIWRAAYLLTSPLPTDPELICETVRRDRVLAIKESKMADKNAATTTAAAAPGEGMKDVNGRTSSAPAPKFASDAKITFGKDKEGKPYGKDNNPKRAGSKSADRFALYKDGMTTKEFLEAGGTSADLSYDNAKGFIEIK